MPTAAHFRVYTMAELAALELPPIAPEPATAPTWQELVALEPRLADVERLALELHPRAAQDDWLAWATIKRAFMPLVGFEAEQYALRHSAAYNVAYDHLLNVWETGREMTAKPRTFTLRPLPRHHDALNPPQSTHVSPTQSKRKKP